MALKILFVHADYYWSIGTLQKEPSYAEGLASMSAVLKREGHRVSLYHMLAPETREEFTRRLQEENADIIGFTVRTTFYPRLKELTAWARDACPSAFIICGGYHASLAPEDIMKIPAVDAVCMGEGEYPLLELSRGLEQGADVSGINNLWVRTPGGVVKNSMNPLIGDLDSLPLPDFDLFDYPNLTASNTSTALVMISRGCPFSCTYCCNHRFRNLYPDKRNYSRFRSPEGAIEYLKDLLGKHSFIQYINFMDNILGLDKEWLRRFSYLYQKEIGLPFACRVRPNLVDEEIVTLLKDAGCYLAFQGVESGNPDILNRVLRRGTTVEQIENSFRLLHKAGIQTLAYNMVGLPYENLSKVLETVKLNARIKPRKFSVSPFYPYPGTDLHRISMEEGYIPEDRRYEDTTPLQQPGFPRKQVVFAQRYLPVFVSLYKFAGKLPGPLRRITERILGSFFCTPYKPHGLLNSLALGRSYILYHSKKFIGRYFPSVYIFLRNLLGGYRIGKSKGQ